MYATWHGHLWCGESRTFRAALTRAAASIRRNGSDTVCRIVYGSNGREYTVRFVSDAAHTAHNYPHKTRMRGGYAVATPSTAPSYGLCIVCGAEGPPAGPAWSQSDGWHALQGHLDPVLGWLPTTCFCPTHRPVEVPAHG